MLVILVRHASAESSSPRGDAGRRLTAQGRTEAQAVGKALRAMGIDLGLILTSPLVRAVETGQAMAKAHPKAACEEADLMAPPADLAKMKRRLTELESGGLEAVALVGHAPSLDECLGQLVAGVDNIGFSFPKAGAACVEVGPGPNELRWAMRRETLMLLADAKGRS